MSVTSGKGKKVQITNVLVFEVNPGVVVGHLSPLACGGVVGTGAFEIRSDPCSTHILGVSGH